MAWLKDLRRAVLLDLFGIDLRSLALFRVGIATILLGDLLLRLPDLEAFYTDFGVLPRQYLPAAWGGRSYLCFHAWTGSVAGEAFLFGLAAVFAVMLLVGYKTRLATIASWLLLISLHNRNTVILQGADILLRMLMFWSMFLPLGAYFSLDARRATPPAPESDTAAEGETPRGGGPSVRAFSLATAGVLFQVAFVYWFSAAMKTHPAWWQEGTAVWLALNLDTFATPLGVVVRDYSPPLLLSGATHLTMLLEIAGPVIALLPGSRGMARTAVVFAFWGFHLLALNLTMRLAHFPWVCSVAWILFLPPWFWNVLVPRVWGRLPGSPVKRGIEQVWDRLREAAQPKPDSRRLRPAPRLGLYPIWNVVAGIFLIHVLVWNVRGMDKTGRLAEMLQSTNFVADWTRTDQSWGMFAPRPLVTDGYYILYGTLRDGTTMDLFKVLKNNVGQTEPVGWDKPALVCDTFRSERWRKLMSNLTDKKHRSKRPLFGEYLRRWWNRQHPEREKELIALDIYWMRERTPDHPGISIPTPVRVTLYRQIWAEPGSRPMAPVPATAPVATQMVEAAQRGTNH